MPGSRGSENSATLAYFIKRRTVVLKRRKYMRMLESSIFIAITIKLIQGFDWRIRIIFAYFLEPTEFEISKFHQLGFTVSGPNFTTSIDNK